MRYFGLSFFVAFVLILSLLAVPALAPPTASASPARADLPNPLTVDFSGTVVPGDSLDFNVTPNATHGSIVNQFSRERMMLNDTNWVNTTNTARFFNVSTTSGSISGDLSGSIEMSWTRLDFDVPYFNSDDWFIKSGGDPTGVGILFIRANMTDTVLGDLTFAGVLDLDYRDSLVKGEGLVCTFEPWEKPPPCPQQVLIGEISCTISGTTITCTFNLRNYAKNPVGLEGVVNTQMESLTLAGQLTDDEADPITNDTMWLNQFTGPPIQTCQQVVLEEMIPAREAPQTIISGDIGTGGTISLQRTGILDVQTLFAGSEQEVDLPVQSSTATRTTEDNTGSTNSSTHGGIAKSIVLVDMFDFKPTGVWQHAYTFMPGYSWGYDGPYEGTGYYAGFEAYVIAATYINTDLWLEGPDYRYALLPTPVVSSVSPNVGKAGDIFDVNITGKWFWINETYHSLTIDLGDNVTVNSHVVVSDTLITANITVDNPAPPIGPWNVTVTKRGVSGTLVDGFGIGSAFDGNVTFCARTGSNVELLDVKVYEQGNLSNVIWSGTRITNEDGEFVIATGLSEGACDISITNRTCLTELVTNQQLVLGQSTSIDFGTTREGDANGDDWITIDDLSTMFPAWNTKKGNPAYLSSCDANHDGWVTIDDLSAMFPNWNTKGDLVGKI